jgi:hypothetical protein
LGRSQRRAARSLQPQIIQHLLKLRLQPDWQSERHWKQQVNGFRDQLRDVFAENPSLRAARVELAADLWSRAAGSLRRDLNLDGFDGRAAMAPLPDPAEPYFDLDREVLADEWYPPPHAA